MRTRNLIAVGLLAALMGACGGDSITGTTSVAGKYTLQTLDGMRLPVVVLDQPGFKLEITDGDVVLAENGTFTSNVTVRQTVQGTVTTSPESSTGTYTVNGSEISFNSPGEPTIQGTLSGGTLTITFVDEGDRIVAVYQK